jgi:hypothetical protein
MKKNIIYRSQIITGFKGKTKSTYYNRFNIPRRISNRDVEAVSPERPNNETRSNPILSSIRRYSGRESHDDSDSDGYQHSNESDPRRLVNKNVEAVSPERSNNETRSNPILSSIRRYSGRGRHDNSDSDGYQHSIESDPRSLVNKNEEAVSPERPNNETGSNPILSSIRRYSGRGRHDNSDSDGYQHSIESDPRRLVNRDEEAVSPERPNNETRSNSILSSMRRYSGRERRGRHDNSDSDGYQHSSESILGRISSRDEVAASSERSNNEARIKSILSSMRRYPGRERRGRHDNSDSDGYQHSSESVLGRISNRDEVAASSERPNNETRSNSILSSMRRYSGREGHNDFDSDSHHHSSESVLGRISSRDEVAASSERPNNETRSNSILSSMRRYSGRERQNDSDSDSHHYSSKSKRTVLGMTGVNQNDCLRNYVQPQIDETCQGSSRRSLSSSYNDGRGSASVISSIRTRARGWEKFRCRYLCLGLSLFGFFLCGFIFQENIASLPLVKNLFSNNEVEPRTKVPSEAPSPSPISLFDKSPTNARSQNPSSDSQRPSAVSKRMETFRPSTVLSSIPSHVPSIKVCNATSYEDRKFRYEMVAQITFHIPTNSDGSKYTEAINWLAIDDYVDVCETSHSLLVEKIVWALVYFELSTTYDTGHSWREDIKTTLAGYLTFGNHCDRHDNYFPREWAVVCDSNGYITELELHGRDRNEGELPTEITYLSKLQKLVVTNSPNIFGTIPTGIFALADLEHLDFTNLGLSGELFPDAFFAAKNENPPSTRMKVLKLGSDASLLWSWRTIDKSLMKEPQIQDITNNAFMAPNLNTYNISTLPADELQSFKILEELALANANLIGTIPDFDQVTSLKSLSLWGNSLEGTIPAFPADIQIIRLNANKLVGNIPDGLGQYRKLMELELGNNPLGGVIPSSIAELSALNSLHLCE